MMAQNFKTRLVGSDVLVVLPSPSMPVFHLLNSYNYVS